MAPSIVIPPKTRARASEVPEAGLRWESREPAQLPALSSSGLEQDTPELQLSHQENGKATESLKSLPALKF